MSIWREDPTLKGKFHPDFPDDLQVLVHEGSFRFTETRPEGMWVRLIAKIEATLQTGDKYSFYKGILLNQPFELKTVKQYQEIYLVGAEKYPHPIRITPEYVADRPLWEITPCNKCGLPEAFDPIPALWEKSFPNVEPEAKLGFRVFTSFCPMCGGDGFLAIKEIKKNNPPTTEGKPET